LATPDPVPKKETTAIGGKAECPATGQPSETSDPVPKKEPTTIAGRTEGPASDQFSETVLKKAKITVAAKMEDPASVEFVDIKRAVKKSANRSRSFVAMSKAKRILVKPPARDLSYIS
jgi:hypothetical protein